MIALLALLLSATQPCADHAETLQGLSASNISSVDLRARATAALNSARPDLAQSFPESRIGLDPIIQGFARRFAEVDDAGLRTEISDVASSLLEVCRRAGSPSSVRPALVERDRLTSILARPEFDLQDEPIGVLDRVWRWLRKVVLSLLEARGTAAYGEAGRYLVLALGVMGAIFVGYRVVTARSTRKTEPSTSASSSPQAFDSPEEHLLRAREAAGQGDPRRALREEMLAVLATLERHRLAAPGRAETNREIAAEASLRGASAETADLLATLADWYDRTWYGLAGVTPDQLANFSAQAELVRAGAERSVR